MGNNVFLVVRIVASSRFEMAKGPGEAPDLRPLTPTMHTMYKIARAFQLLGLIILPLAISGNVAEKLTLQESLLLSGAGMFIFFVGWGLQQKSK